MKKENTKNQIFFNFSYFALHLLGKGLYSNAWTAIAELVANGFDAQAKHVKIYINAINKEKSVIEIFDDGYGMGYNDLAEKYTLIGKDKRKDNTIDDVTKSQLMGRKGIGKLAALYLSKKYYLISKTKDETSAWCLDSLNTNPSDIPSLERKAIDEIEIESKDYWDSFATGTMIKLTNVDLRNFGEQSLKGLKARFSDFFLLDSLSGKIEIAYISRRNENIVFEEVKKEIAFGNMYAFFNNTEKDFSSELQKSLNFKSDVKSIAEKRRPIIFLDKEQFHNISGEKCFLLESGHKTEIGIPYELKGWIGIHSTIDNKEANKNDKRYLKNKVYNPNRLRLYVRNKLAVENFLDYLKNTQAFSNYIEGEISFDILDNDILPDIATTNRQGFEDENDRVQLLVEILKPIVNSLIRQRIKIADTIKAEEQTFYEEEKRQAEEAEAKAKKETEEAKQAKAYAEQRQEAAEQERDVAKSELKSEQKRNSFLTVSLSSDKKEMIEKFHLLKVGFDTIKKKIGNVIQKKYKGKLSEAELWETLKFISLHIERMKAVFSYGLQANFNTEDEKINADLFDFISDYCNSVLHNFHKPVIKVTRKTQSNIITRFSAQDIGAILENAISNSEKADAKTFEIIMDEDDDNFTIDITDDGTGIDKKKISNIDDLFEFGKSFTESGSGVGLYHIREIVTNKLHGTVSINKNRNYGFELNIRIKK